MFNINETVAISLEEKRKMLKKIFHSNLFAENKNDFGI